MFSCNQNKIDKNIVIKIGKLEITKYEFEKNKVRDLVENAADSRALSDPLKMEKWKRDYINRCLIISEAYEDKFDTIEYVKKIVEYTGNYMMAQRYGYLWKKIISPIVDSKKVVSDEVIKKRKKLYYFDCIMFDNKESAIDVNKDEIPVGKEDFLKLKLKTNKIPSNSNEYISIQWPFIGFWENREYLYEMKEGDVSKLLSMNNKYVYLYLDHIEEVPLNKNDLQNVSTELQIGTESDLIRKMDIERDSICQPVLNINNIGIIGRFLNEGNSISQFKQDLELIRYNVDNSMRKIGFKTFLEYYSFQPMKAVINNEKSLSDYVREFYMDDYLINEAQKLDLYRSDIFILDQKNYKNNLLYQIYLDEAIAKKIEIDSTEILTFYKNNLQQFEQPKKIRVNIYAFNNKESAIVNQNTISKLLMHNEILKTTDSTTIKGLVKYNSDVDINMESLKENVELKSIILETKKGTLSQFPVFYNGLYILAFKVQEEGECFRKLEEVRPKIENNLRSEKIESERNALVEKLNKKFKIEIDKTI